jgi:hypothetical protein
MNVRAALDISGELSAALDGHPDYLKAMEPCSSGPNSGGKAKENT